MNYQVLYRTYRPAKFSEVVGQEYIIKTLHNAIIKNRIAHAYLFAGPRGTGKTTIAKLFAKAINCENMGEEPCDACASCEAFKNNRHPDIVEMDAASNNGVDAIRELIDKVAYAPILGKYKVYIIDEVHMLSTSAFNALLKTLEEPPAHVVFILATTDPQKIIPTVLSRCQRYNFSKISNPDIKRKMEEILNKEEIAFESEALDEVAILAEGGMRDALSILEQILAYNGEGVYLQDVQKIFGLSSTKEKTELLKMIHHNNISEAIVKIRTMYQGGIDPHRLAIDLLDILKEVVLFANSENDSLLSRLNIQEAQELLDQLSCRTLFQDIDLLKETVQAQNKSDFFSRLELCLIAMSEKNDNRKEEKITVIKEEKKEAIEEKLSEKEEATKEKKKPEKKIDLDYLAKILLSASKDEKINDAIIYNKLELYKLEAEKRKFYELLNKTELFASAADAIVIVAGKNQAANINSPEINNELYRFLVEDYGIDKVVYAIEEDQKADLVNRYRALVKEKKTEPVEVIKPVIVKEKTKEEKLKEMFDFVRIEE